MGTGGRKGMDLVSNNTQVGCGVQMILYLYSVAQSVPRQYNIFQSLKCCLLFLKYSDQPVTGTNIQATFKVT